MEQIGVKFDASASAVSMALSTLIALGLVENVRVVRRPSAGCMRDSVPGAL